MPVAIVTGCSQGIGRAIAFRLAEDGFSVALNDLDFKRPALEALAAELSQHVKDLDTNSHRSWAKGRTVDYKASRVFEAPEISEQRFIVVPGDISNEQRVKAMVEDVAAVLGGLDVVRFRYILCTLSYAYRAIVYSRWLRMQESLLEAHFSRVRLSSSSIPLSVTKNIFLYVASSDDLDHILTTNTKGVFFCFKHAALQMLHQGHGGRLIAACSLTGKQGAEGLVAYSASKFAIRGIIQSSAKELCRMGITVNGYAPGAIMTEMRKSAFCDYSYSIRFDSAFIVKEAAPRKPDGSIDWDCMANLSPSQTIGTPEDIAGVVSYLASPESKFVTGQTISVDGGAAA
jgi:NAD(P)-dependent dehydrogenase (short-subunit alcohol dehydrogenase family)